MDYKEKLQEAKRLYETATADQKYVLESLFPELKESEDEKIRKAIIAYLKDDIEELSYEAEIEELKKYLAWLEKQGEQKPAWSEEDEKIFGRICALIHSAAYKNYDIDEDGNECGEYANIKEWFKKLKDRVQLQNITITDEELAKAKKDAYNDALDKIEYHSGEPTFDDGWSAAIWYLKKRNAQPQSQWKPSDEQMELLKDASARYEGLQSLYNDLKKIKGE